MNPFGVDPGWYDRYWLSDRVVARSRLGELLRAAGHQLVALAAPAKGAVPAPVDSLRCCAGHAE